MFTQEKAQEILREYASLGHDLMESGKLELQDASIWPPIYYDPQANCSFGKNLGILDRMADIHAMKRLAQGKPYRTRFPNTQTSNKHKAQEQFQQNFSDTYGDEFTLIGEKTVASKQFPELTTNLRNTKNPSAVPKDIDNFGKQVAKYKTLLEELEQLGIVRDDTDGDVCLKDFESGEIKLAFSGGAKDVIKKSQSLLKNEKQKADEKQKAGAKPREPKATKKQKPEVPSAQVEVFQQEVEVEDHLDKPVQQEFAQHDTLYKGEYPIIRETDRVVILDTGVLMRCFGNTGDDEISAHFGEAVFQSLLDNPHIDKIIIPDYIADIELGGRRVKNDNGHVTTEFIREKNIPGGDYFRPRLEQLLKTALRRHIGADNEETYFQAGDVKPESINPKIIIWESNQGQQCIQEYKATYLSKTAVEGRENTLNKGEDLIEEIMASLPFNKCKKLVLTTDINYAGDTDHKKNALVCRANLGHYLQNLIIKNISKWSGLAAYSPREQHETLAKSAINIRDVMRERFNQTMPEMHQQDYIRTLTTCDNHDLFSEITGLTSLANARNPSAVVQAMKAISAAPTIEFSGKRSS